MIRARTVAAVMCLAALGMCVWWLIHPASWQGPSGFYALMPGVWLLFAAAVWLVRSVPRKSAAVLILAGGIGLPLLAGFSPPRSSDDLYRYLWDGRVQAAGISPYEHVPAAPQLAHLRDGFLWPQHSSWCVPPGELTPGCTLVNRPTVHTIYPPVAQAYFLGVEKLSPPDARERPIQIASSLVAAAVTVLLLIALPKVGADPRLAALWAWCPLVVIEAGNNAHLDVVGALLAASALIAAALARSWRGSAAGGVLLGLAIATKITPALVGPSMLRRRPLLVLTAAIAGAAVVYLPHVLAVGPAVLGYLPDYLSAEGYESGDRFALLSLVFAPSAATIVAALILVATAVAAWRRSDPKRPWNTAVVTTGVFLLVSTPAYSWYAILLVVLVALSNRPEWLAVAAAGYLAQYASNFHLSGTAAQRIGYGAAAVIVVAVAARRLQRDVTEP